MSTSFQASAPIKTQVLKAQQPAPLLSLPTINGEPFVLANQTPRAFTMLVFYRGYHCPTCKMYIKDLDMRYDRFIELGIQPVAISSNDRTLALAAYQDWGLSKTPLAYNLSEADAHVWGLHISDKLYDGEPESFSEPGLYFIAPDNTVFASVVQSMPFARPNFQELLAAFDYIIKSGYPARGER